MPHLVIEVSNLPAGFKVFARLQVSYNRPFTTGTHGELSQSQLQRLAAMDKRWWCAELHRLRSVFLATVGAEEARIEASFREALRIAKEQKSISLATRAETSYAEYRRQKASASGGRGFQLPLC